MTNDPSEKPAPGADAEDARHTDGGAPVVALCASAGGLDAFKAFLGSMPADSGFAFVLVPHLDPTHESLLVDLLARCTPMPVSEAVEDVVVQRNCVYVLPPNKYMTISGRTLHLTGPVERTGLQTSIDLFLRSLAEDLQENAIGIVLSGTGSHGTAGLQAIKAAGGLVMVQSPETAAHVGMPRSAVDSGLADFVLPVEQMPPKLVDYVRHRGSRPAVREVAAAAISDLDAILALVEERTRIDFRGYRKKVLVRRIDRRMGLGHFKSIGDYLAFLRAHPEEVLRLYQDLLIRVTSFFRDAEAFEILTERVLAPVIQGKSNDEPLRIWVPACATGEEAYSIAILCLEQLALAGKHCPLQVFATDVDDAPLDVARRGVYPSSIAADVSSTRLAQFFTRMGNSGYAVSKELRGTVVIAVQNLIADAPFSRLDLIACRNLLIYLEPDLQQKVLSLFHFALREGGSLLLGSSETIGRQSELFEPVSRKWRVYKRVGPGRPDRVTFPITSATTTSAAAPVADRAGQSTPRLLANLMERTLLEEMAPAAVLVDHAFKILHYHGPARRYLDYPVGEPTQGLLALVADGLRARLRAALHRAMRDGKTVVVPDAQVKRNGSYVHVRVLVRPVQASPTGPRLLLVKFEDVATSSPPAAERSSAEEPLVHQLEYELKVVREDFQSNIEELERSNEDLRTAHEEVLSMNEELQSANEELETSKEELQSLNEEILTVNSQLQEKVDELERAHSDITNLMDATDLAVVFLDTQMCIRRFTPAMAKLLPITAEDVGRALSTFASPFTRGDLQDDIDRTRARQALVEAEVESDDGRTYLRRIVPYRTADVGMDGFVVTLLDVTEHVATMTNMRRMAAVLADSADAIFTLDLAGRIDSWNHGAERMFGYTEVEALGLSIEDLVPKELRAGVVATLRSVATGEAIAARPTVRVTKDGRMLDVLVSTTPLRNASGEVVAIAETDRDVTDLLEAQRSMRTLNQALERRISDRTHALAKSEGRLLGILATAIDGIVTSDRNGVIISVNPAALQMFGYSESELVGQDIASLIPPDDKMASEQLSTIPQQPGVHVSGGREVRCRRGDGSTFPADVTMSSFEDEDEDEDGPMFTAIVRDISLRKEIEGHLAEVRLDEQQRIARDMHDGLGGLLTGIGMLAETIHVGLARRDSSLTPQMQALVGYVRDADDQLRHIAHGLMPVDVTPEGLSVALQRLAKRHDAADGLRCSFRGTRRVELPSANVAAQLYYIAEEAVSNAIRHGQPSQVTLELVDDDGMVTLRVGDDGIGTPSSDDGGGMGLRAMRHRASDIGASLEIRANASKGTMVVCTLPKAPPDEAVPT